MGDRAITIFYAPAGKTPCRAWESKTAEFSPVIYQHWCGGPEGMKETLSELAHLMKSNGRDGDDSYAAARYCGILHTRTPGALSLGLWNGPETMEDARSTEQSHGDAGVFLVNCSTWEVDCFGGYGFGDGPCQAVKLLAPEPVRE